MSDNYLKIIQSLEKRISELESQKNSQMFGRSYNQVGSLDSDYLIKTKGQIKIQWGNKFIDLIKDGKVNTDTKFIYKQSTVGTKDGIYITNDSITLVAGGEAINLTSDSGNVYVSYLEPQETTPNQKYQALRNIGFLYPSLDEYDSVNGLSNGIIYVESERKLYTVVNGVLNELQFSIPNPFTEQFVIQKNDQNEGALVIKGERKPNSLKFDSMFIYSEGDMGIINCNGLQVKIQDSSVLSIQNGKISTIYSISSNGIQSPLFSSGLSGYSIYKDGDKWILEIDKIIERDAQSSTSLSIPKYLNWNIITSVESGEDSSLQIQLLLEKNYKTGDILEIQRLDSSEEFGNILSSTTVTITDITDNIITISSDEDLSELTEGTLVYKIKTSDPNYRVVRAVDNLDITDTKNVDTRIGNLTELNLKEIDNQSEVDIEGYGIFSKQGYFKKAGYVSDYVLPEEDNSSKFASTEWVRNLLESQFSPGYYWSSEMENNKPKSPKFIGTSQGNFKVSESQPYLWYSNDGEVWILIDQYIPEDDQYIYFASSLYRYYEPSLQFSNRIPSGFFTWVDNTGQQQKNIGVSNWISNMGYYDNDGAEVPRWPQSVMNMIDKMGTPKAGVRPNTEGYTVLWIIPADQWSSNKYNPLAYQMVMMSSGSTIAHANLQQLSLYSSFALMWGKQNGNSITLTKAATSTKNIQTEEFWTDPYSITTFFGIFFRDWLLNGTVWGSPDYRNQIYSKETGWSLSYENVAAINVGQYSLYGSGTIEPIEPTENSGVQAIPHPRLLLSFTLTSGVTTVQGSITIQIGAFRRDSNSDDEKYLVQYSGQYINALVNEWFAIPEVTVGSLAITYATNDERAIRKTITWYGGETFYIKDLYK